MNTWKSWFAWYPVKTLGGRWVWLKEIERRQQFFKDAYNPVGGNGYMQYRLPKVSFYLWSPDAMKFSIDRIRRRYGEQPVFFTYPEN